MLSCAGDHISAVKVGWRQLSPMHASLTLTLSVTLTLILTNAKYPKSVRSRTILDEKQVYVLKACDACTNMGQL